MKFILGLKLGITQVFDEKGNIVPVTLIEAGPCTITQIKIGEPQSTTKGKLLATDDSYEAIQIGLQQLKEKKVKKTQKKKPFRYLREFRGDIDISKYKEGDRVDASTFQEGDMVKITGISKGKGFSGVVKRWGFHGRPATHGTKHELRTPGSVGSSFPERVTKGKKMAGRMGHERITIKNLKIIKVDPEKNLITVQGAVPGVKGDLLEIRG